MRSASKTVLYTKTGTGATTKVVPVAVFPNEAKSRTFAVAVMNAYKSGDQATIKALGCGHLVTEAGTLAEKLRFTKVTVPYDPAFAASDVDPFAEESSATA